MKKIMRVMLFIAMLIAMNSCSADTADGNDNSTPTEETLITNYTYNDSELETMQLINEYRLSIGLNALQIINHISAKCQEHNTYMIANNVMNHNDFVLRSDNLVKVLGAKKVGENVAYNYKTSEAVVKAWLESPGHKENIEGDYTHFGLAVTTDKTGKKYYTNIFVKI
ncbi:CAP domain-containing protein [Flavobacterium sp. JLP]|uniref:CAP domain-containing protein n=1 Tax=unclassified Flavobacterium TaxID=196869 RepID=UPI0004938414|nr:MULTISPECIES: CAP domain-containing protein [unclassified Flavobacterium]MBF4493081.1 CAP domain-containing protein [Flavobacterium sp. MR2016-29]MBF4507353.1 CAP domain-containing protein [Flavobacterium sp. JLP]